MSDRTATPTPSLPLRRSGSAIAWILGINVAVYLLQLTLVTSSDMLDALGFHSSSVGSLGKVWWTIGTYMFVHTGFWHLALTMCTLLLFGPRVQSAWTSGEFARYYLFCGFGGWFLELFIPGDHTMIGASAAVMGVALAFATLWPHERVQLFGLISMRIGWFVVLVVALNLMGGMAWTPTGDAAYLAHVGGLGAGWLYLRTSARMTLADVRRHVAPVPDVSEEDIPHAVPKSHRQPREPNADDAVIRSKAITSEPRTAVVRPRVANGPASTDNDVTRLNHVLDKISASGLESLTPEERQLLDDAARRRRED